MRFFRDNALSVFFGTIFVLALFGQSVAGHRAVNEERAEHGEALISYPRYVRSSDFGEAVMENWQSEYLQFVLFIIATVWLVQRGSAESKPLEDIGLESDQKQMIGAYAQANSPAWAKARGWRTKLYGNSLLLVMVTIFFASWFAQSVTGRNAYNDEQARHDQPTVSWTAYVLRAEFWEKTLQNWQSEFLAVGTMAVFTIYLRQRGSPESKPVGAPHEHATGATG